MSFWLAIVLIWAAACIGFIFGAGITNWKLADELCWHCGRGRKGPA